ncbi:glycosyltransferase family 2 protein [Patescibacteria group bacterium]
MSDKKIISVVVPVYNEEKNINDFYNKLVEIFDDCSECDFEIIFVDDGSRDASILEIEKIAENDRRIKGISFSRNFGKEVATSAGCHSAKGDAVVTMDADLQHPPELIKDFIDEWNKGFEVVYTVRMENEGASFMKKLTSNVYWWIFNKISSYNSESRTTDFRLMDRRVIDEFNKFSERGRLFRGIVDWMGYKRSRIEFVAAERNSGDVAYSYNKLIALAINSFTAFSMMPLRLAGYFGVVITSGSFLLFAFMIVTRFFSETIVFSPIAYVIVANTLLIGIVLTCLGFIALYIARIHDEVINRPLYIIRNKINIDE